MFKKLTRDRKKELGLAELIAIALGGMVGGGIFSILGVSVERIGNATPIAILVGGVLAYLAAFSYVRLAKLYKDEGATYSFFKKTFPKSRFASSIIGWLVVFGYISTLALYAFTFSSYLCSVLPYKAVWMPKLVAALVISLFAIVNILSVKGMGKIEDILVYTKIVILLFISGLLAGKGDIDNVLPMVHSESTFVSIFIMAAVTFVAYEGFQLVIHAYNEMSEPERNIPRAIYSAVIIATLLYIAIALGALSTIPKELIIQDKEYALASGSRSILGSFGLYIVIFGALLATSSAISGTIFGASRLMAVISTDGYLPKYLSNRINGHIPNYAIITMSLLSFVLILSGGLEVILEFGSITFIIVSFLMAFANYKKRKETNTSLLYSIIVMTGLLAAALVIFYYEYEYQPAQLIYIGSLYAVLTIMAFVYARMNKTAGK
ncbi:MAG: amino acid permease [Chitinophagales bacterium]|nr:amino acid permease [Chitinophagaceae bacterium]MCB9065663.1 amino acid permease [Chitinophagales bacterium]